VGSWVGLGSVVGALALALVVGTHPAAEGDSASVGPDQASSESDQEATSERTPEQVRTLPTVDWNAEAASISVAPARATKRVSGRLLRASDGSAFEQRTTFWFEGSGGLSGHGLALDDSKVHWTERDGSFDVPDVRIDSTHIVFPIKDSQMCGNSRTDHRKGRNRIALPAGVADVVDLQAQLLTGKRFSGQVLDEAGDPLPEVRVSLDCGTQVWTTATGQFEIQDVLEVGQPLWSHDAIRVRHPAYVKTCKVRRAAEVADVAKMEFRLVPSGSLEGRIVDEGGEPLVNHFVYVMPHLPLPPNVSEEDADMIDQVVTDATGRFRIDGIPPGRVRVVAWRHDPPRLSDTAVGEAPIERGLTTHKTFTVPTPDNP